MGKRITYLVLPLFMVGMGILGFNSSVQAGATILTNVGGLIFDGNASRSVPCSAMVVLTNNKKGRYLVSCHAKGVANDTGRAQRFDQDDFSISCYTVGDSWHETISRNGNATLICSGTI